eukprot:CAMPEP_0119042328 /NCGR_PEP_ID=MMETSP1177-20130426/14548_1 /TAXON_ID=2985 /ORGANISM="Ochromonas sp, Strain CCMP1899" /LENGTH=421 /DNA_ID=CAMNT_0007009025 /DNA_START=66 /DNA_END=1328 /DNA_ORIENTATION=-
MASENEYTTSKNQYTLFLIYVNVALYATCYQIQRPLEPFLVEKLGLNGDSGGDYAKLQSFFSVMQTVGSFMAGPFLDRFGAKGGFIISFLASALSYLLLSQATTLNLLYISKIPTIFQAGFLCAQLAASQATSDGADRVKALGRLTMSYTIGSVIGPSLGGFLGASGDYYFGAKIAVVGSLISVIMALYMPANKSTKKKDYIEVNLEDDGKEIDLDNIKKDNFSYISIYNIISLVWLLLSTKIITSVANAMSAAAFPIILKDIYKLNETGLGISMSAMSAFNGVVNGLLLAPMVSFFNGNLANVIGFCITAMTVISVLLSVAAYPAFAIYSPLPGDGMYEFLILTFVLSMFQYILSTTITGESTAMVKKNEKGTLLGLEHSFFAAARIAAPQAGITLLKIGGVSAVSAACALVFSTVLFIW